MTVNVDMSEIDDLVAGLERTAKKISQPVAMALLREEGATVTEEARGIAGSYPNGTGRLANDVALKGVNGWAVRIASPWREGYFLEYGSPNTGAPRPWLSGPAEKGLARIAEKVSKLADPGESL